MPEIPAALDDLVARATAVEPDDRFESATAFVTALREVRRGLSAAELDHRGAAVVPDPDSTSALAPTSATTQLPPVDRPSRSGAAGCIARSATARVPTSSGPSALAGRAVHDDGPLLEHTAAMPIDRRQRAGARRRWPLWIAAALIVAGASFGGWWFTAGPGGSTVVPAVVGQQISQAEGAMRQASLSALTIGEFSEVKAKGVVLRVEPSAGSELGKRSTVRLVVSKGQERYAVPNLVGLKADGLGSALSP